MTNFNYLRINKSRKIRYLTHKQKNATYIVFLHGFMSNLEGKKPKTFLNFAKRNKMGFSHLNTLDMENLVENLLMVIFQNGRKKQLKL